MNSYLKFLSRHRLFTVINIVGLCLSMAFLLLLGDLIYRQTTVENYQTRGDRTFVVGNEEFMMSHFRVGQKLKDRFPEIEDWCSVSGLGITFSVKGQEAPTKMLLAAPNFFEFFDYRLLSGDRHKVLSAPNQMVVSKKFAQRYWPHGDAIGKEVVFQDSQDAEERLTFTISGIMDDFDRSVIPSDYECVVNLENLRHLHYSAYVETMNNAASCVLFLMAKEGCDLQSKTTDMRDYLKTFFWIYRIGAVKSSDPVYHGMTPQQKENYSKAIAGEYTGTYVILYNDGGGDDKAVKIKNSQMTITDQTMHSVCFHDYPVSQLSGVVADSALAKALASAPNVDFQADYRFYDLQDNGDTHWGFEPAAIPLTLHYGGADHHLVLKLNSQTYFLMSKASMDAGKPFANQSVFQFTVDGIYEGHTLLQAFDDWQDNAPEYLTYFQFE